MNPSYGNGMPSASGGRPGVISSGPDSASTPPVSMPNVSGRAGSGFGRTSGSGGPKKGIIIGGILMILALGLGTAAVVVMMGGQGGGETSSAPMSAAEAFSKLNTHMETFETIVQDESLEAQKAFFEEAKEETNDLINVASGDNEIYQEIMNFSDGLDVTAEVAAAAYTDVFEREYLEGGTKSLEQHLKNNENLKLDDNSLYYTAVAVVERDLITKLGEFYKILTNNNCKTENGFDSECMDNLLANDATASAVLDEATSAKLKLRGYLESIASRVMSMLSTIGENL